MTSDVILFTLVALVTAGSAVGVLLSRSVIRSAVWLLGSLVGVSLVYFLLGADFLGAAQLIVYVGGTMVLVVFGGMLTAGGPFAGLSPKAGEWAVASLIAATLFVALVVVSLKIAMPSKPPETLPHAGQLGLGFLGVPDAVTPGRTTYLLPFEVVSVHLLVVLVGAAYLARAKKKQPA
jgi:NADH-quinone oxidoreductase subunit J